MKEKIQSIEPPGLTALALSMMRLRKFTSYRHEECSNQPCTIETVEIMVRRGHNECKSIGDTYR
jgi:hypothetical protein